MAKKSIKAIASNVILHIVGSKGDAFRMAKQTGKTTFQLCQNNAGLSYAGAIIDIAPEAKLDKQAKLELGGYIAGKGSSVKVTPLSIKQAEKLASHPVTIIRNGHSVGLMVTKLDAQYSASIERFASGKSHFFQWESKKLPNNAKHYGKLEKSK